MELPSKRMVLEVGRSVVKETTKKITGVKAYESIKDWKHAGKYSNFLNKLKDNFEIESDKHSILDDSDFKSFLAEDSSLSQQEKDESP